MKIATPICVVIEILILGGIICSYTLNITLGIILTIAWLPCGTLIMSLGQEIDADPEEILPEEIKKPKFTNLVGEEGKTISVLNPSGLIEIGNEKIEATALMGLIETGMPVKIVGAKANVVIVEKQDD